MSYVLVDGDPGCVYPGITADLLVNDPGAINQFFPEACAAQMAEYTREMLNGKQSDPFELVWKSAPGAAHDLCVVVVVEEVLRYTNSDGNTTCLMVGHTTDATSLIRAHEAQLAGVQHQTEQKLIDHRIANMVHTASLFVQDQKPQEAIAQLGHIRNLIDVCRDRRELLSTAPVVLSALLSRAFVHGFVCEQREQTVQFLAENELLPPDLLCYRILDTIASICFEYGNATPVRLQVSGNGITIFKGTKQPSTQSCNCSNELNSLREKTTQMGITFECSVSRSLLQIELGLICALSDPGPTSLVSTLESAASQFAWVVLEDEAFQAKMVAARIKSKGGGEVVIVQSALQVSTFIETLVYSALYNVAAHQKPTICFMDENVMTLDSHGQPVAITGTQLRQQLRVHPRACQLLQDSKLFLVGLSGESVSDDLLVVSLMKGARMNEMIGEATVDDPEVSSSVDIERISCRSAESSAVIESWKGCNTDDMMVQKIY